MLFRICSGVMQTTAALASMSTGTAIKTLLQVKAIPELPFEIVEWGISFDGSSAATPGKIELITTDVAATVSALAAADITDRDGLANACTDLTKLFTFSTSATGYAASGEGSITTVQNLDGPEFIAPTNQFIKQMPLGTEPIVIPGKYARIRATFASAVNCYAHMTVRI